MGYYRNWCHNRLCYHFAGRVSFPVRKQLHTCLQTHSQDMEKCAIHLSLEKKRHCVTTKCLHFNSSDLIPDGAQVFPVSLASLSLSSHIESGSRGFSLLMREFFLHSRQSAAHCGNCWVSLYFDFKVLTFYVKCLEIMYIMIWRYTNKIELN